MSFVVGMSADDRDGVGCGRIPFDEYHLDVAVQHYQDLALTSGLSLPQYASAIARDRGFLDDHEYASDSYYHGIALTGLRVVLVPLGIRSCSTSSPRREGAVAASG